MQENLIDEHVRSKLEETPNVCILKVKPERLETHSDLQKSMDKISAFSNFSKQNLTYEEHVDKIMSREQS